MSNYDLSRAPTRQQAQSRLTTNRPAVIPTDSRLDRMDPVRDTYSMRNASRGDAQVDEVRRFVGLLGNAVNARAEVSQQEHLQAERENASVAAQDSALGQENAELAARSEAYRIVIADGRVNRVLTENASGISQSVLDAVIAADGADPTKGEHPFTLEDANAKFDELVKGLMLDKDGQPIDYGDRRANTTLYQGIANLRANVLQRAAEQIALQEKTKALDSIGQVAINALNGGDSQAIERGIQKGASLGIAAGDVKRMLYHAVIASAVQRKDETILQKVLSSMQADGVTPTWNAAEKGQLMQAYMNFHEEWEKDRREGATYHSNLNMGNLYPEIMAGKLRVTPDLISSLIAKGPENGGITALHADDLAQMQNSVDAKRQQAIQQARSNQQWAWAQQEHADSARRRTAERNVLAMKASFFAGQLTQPEAIKRLDSQYFAGHLGDEEYLETRGFLMSVPTGKALLNKTGAGIHFEVLSENLLAADNLVERSAKGAQTPQQWQSSRRRAQVTFYHTLYSTGDPDAALASALGSVWGSKDKIQQAVSSASRRASAVHVDRVKNAKLDASN